MADLASEEEEDDEEKGHQARLQWKGLSSDWCGTPSMSTFWKENLSQNAGNGWF